MKTHKNVLKIVRSVVSITAVGCLAMLFQNCAKANFANGGGLATSSNAGFDAAYGNLDQPHTNPDSCYTFLHQTTTEIRLLFVVDESGSNTGNNGTDVQQQVRAGSIQAFYNDYNAKTSFQWGFIGFAGSRASAFISSNNSVTMPTFSNASVMQSAITQFKNTQDTGNTPYQAGLDMAITALNNDTTSPATTKYIVVFLSDGLPNPDVSDSTLAQDVTNILNTKPGRVTFNTVYYGGADATASGRLKAMAKTGGGYFLDTNASPSGKSFLISNIVNVPGSTCKP